jgi:hypothetical protein
MEERMLRAYAHHYQHGGGPILVYRMPRRWQCGDGYGDSVRSALRYIIPAVASGAEKYGMEILDRTEKGEKVGRAAKQAIFPALMAVKDRAVQRWKEKRQKGTGQRKHRKRVYKVVRSHKNKKKNTTKRQVKRTRETGDSIINF